jgi:hypothetical protein
MKCKRNIEKLNWVQQKKKESILNEKTLFIQYFKWFQNDHKKRELKKESYLSIKKMLHMSFSAPFKELDGLTYYKIINFFGKYSTRLYIQKVQKKKLININTNIYCNAE